MKGKYRSYSSFMDIISIKALEFGYQEKSRDYNNGRLSLVSEYSLYTIDIYIGKMTVGVTQKKQPTVWLKNVNKETMIELFKEPLNVII